MTKTVGEILRQTREAKQLSLDEIADELAIRVHFLQAIEEDRMGSMASVAQLRGFTRLYASYLGVNPDELLEPPAVERGETELTEITQEREQQKSTRPLQLPKGLIKKQEEPFDPQKQEASINDSEIDTPSASVFRTIGAELQRQREALGLSRFDVERQIKIREIYVHALENGLIDDLPSTVQGRGMLNNYAAFMNLDPESLQLRFAEGLQMRRNEKLAAQEVAKKNPPIKKFSAPITGWRRYLTPDNLIVSGIFALVFVLVLWGAFQVIDTAKLKPEKENQNAIILPSATPMVLATETPSPMPTLAATDTTSGGELANTASVDVLATITSMGNKPIQILVVAYQRAFVKVIVDGMEQFNGRVAPGQAYPFSGSSKITLTTGNAAAIQVYYNQQDLGILGANGQVITMDFSKSGQVTATPQVTSLPTETSLPTMTPRPSYTPTLTHTEITPTVTPFVP